MNGFTYSISKSFVFDYAHRLHKLTKNHKCHNSHGHRGEIRLEIEVSDTDEKGFVIDFGELKFVQEWIDRNWDHSTIIAQDDIEYLNAISILESKHYILKPIYNRADMQTTSENLAGDLYLNIRDKIKKIIKENNLELLQIKIVFFETPDNFATFKMRYNK
jgi:6-pyruvoyl-tetrahydropterin synthase